MPRPNNEPRSPAITNEVLVATRILGTQVGLELVRFLATLPSDRSGAYWREIADALPDYAPTSIRRQLGELEDAGVIHVDVPLNAARGSRRGAPVKYSLDRPRLDAIFVAIHAWLVGGDEPAIRV
ncbi:MAG: hypothetical protein ABWX92_17165 [Mycetocola sp.]